MTTGCSGTAVRGLRALALFGLPWEHDLVMPGRAEEGVVEARGASECDGCSSPSGHCHHVMPYEYLLITYT